ncbi:MAG: carboxypeptidase regulatory-like domain-containing protein [Minicystis sp.]
MRSSTLPPLARRALVLVSLVAAGGCVTIATRNRDQAAIPGDPQSRAADGTAPDPAPAELPPRVVEPLRAAAPLTCAKPAGAVHQPTVAEGNPAARTGAQRGLGFVAREARAWQDKNKCYGCHVQAVTLEALVIGRSNKYDVPRGDLEAMIAGLTTINGGSRGPNGLSVGGGTGLIETSKEFGGAAFARYDALVGPEVRADLLKVAGELSAYQEKDGSLRSSDRRFPVEIGEMQATTQAVQTWRQAFERSADERWLAPMRKAEAYLQERAKKLSADPEAGIVDLNYAAIGLYSAGAQGGEGTMRAIADRLRKLQREDGGWAFSAKDAPTAFATGQTLYALRLLGASDEDVTIARGTRWLVGHQGDDGGWSHDGRGKAEAMWAVLGLVSVDVLSVSVGGVADGQHVGGRVSLQAKAADNAGRGVERIEIAVDDVPVHRACGGAAEYALDADKLETGPHLVDVTATNARGQTSRRRLEIYAGPYYLTQLGTRFDDGGTLVSLRDVAPPSVHGDVVLRVFATRDDNGRPVRAGEVFTAKKTSAEGPMSFFWNGQRDADKPASPGGRYVAEVSFLDARGRAVQKAEVPFVHDTLEKQQQAFGEIEGNLMVNGAAPAANTRVELVDDQGRVVQSATTTNEGNYRFRNVDRGNYKVRVVRQGFQAAEAPVAAAPAAARAAPKMDLQAK